MKIEGVIIIQGSSGIPLFSKLDSINELLFAGVLTAIRDSLSDLALGGISSFTTKERYIYISARSKIIVAVIAPKEDFKKVHSLAYRIGKQFEEMYPELPEVVDTTYFESFNEVIDEILEEEQIPHLIKVAEFAKKEFGGLLSIQTDFVLQNGTSITFDLLLDRGERKTPDLEKEIPKKYRNLISRDISVVKIVEGTAGRGEIMDFFETVKELGSTKPDQIRYFPSKVAVVAHDFSPTLFEELKKYPQKNNKRYIGAKHILPTAEDPRSPDFVKCFIELWKWREEEYPILLTDLLSPETVTGSPIISSSESFISADFSDQIIQTIHNYLAIYKKPKILLAKLAQRVKIDVKLLETALEELILNKRIRAAIDDQGTVDVKDDILILNDNWDVELDHSRQRLKQITQELNTLQKDIKSLIESAKSMDTLENVKNSQYKVKDLQTRAEKWTQEWKNWVKQPHSPIIKPELQDFTQVADGFIQNFNDLETLKKTLNHRIQEFEKEQKRKIDEFREKFQILIQERDALQQDFKKFNKIIPTLKRHKEVENSQTNLKRLQGKTDNWIQEWNDLINQPIIHELKQETNQVTLDVEKFIQLALIRLQTLNDNLKELGTALEETTYRRTKILKIEAEVLIELEDQIDKPISKVSAIRKNIFGFTVQDMHITGLGLYNQSLKTLPESIGKLRNLQRLNLWNNQLSSLPDSLGSLIELEELYLQRNQLKSLPDSLCQLTNLRILDLAGNQFQSLPESFGDLISLEILLLSNNELKLLPKSIGKLEQLKELRLEYTNLDLLPDTFGNLKNLQLLYLYRSQLKSLPETFGNLINLAELHLYRTQLKTLPETFGNLTNLETLNLANNHLTTLPETFGQLNSLNSLNLESNKLSSLPQSFGNLANLQRLNLSNNQLTSLPESFGNLTNLQRPNLGNNQLTSLPESFGNLTKLKELSLNENKLESLSETFGALENLQRLDLAKNQLKSLPETFSNLKSLQILLLNNNQIESLPDSFGKLENLQKLELHFNQLEFLPKSFDQLSNLQKIVLEGNQFKTVPECVKKLQLGGTIVYDL